MLITLSRRAAICQSVAEVSMTGVAPRGAVSHRLNINLYLHVFYILFFILTISVVYGTLKYNAALTRALLNNPCPEPNLSNFFVLTSISLSLF